VSCDRFVAVELMLHLNSNDIQMSMGQSGCDPLCRIYPILNSLKSKFQDVCMSEEVWNKSVLAL
jgi:hypothetical protein